MAWLFAALYDPFMGGAERACLGAWRAELLAEAAGDVLEIGAGTGANLPFYRSSLHRLVLSEPDADMRAKLERRRDLCAALPIEICAAAADALPFDDASFDTVVSTLVLCSVPDVPRVLGELRRVLRPGGRLLFLEHVAADDRPARLAWQRRLEPLWARMSGNCHLTRRTGDAIRAAGFRVERETRESVRKALPIVRPSVRGVAVSVGCAVLTACASPGTTPETPAYHHRFDHADQWVREFDDPSRDAWQRPASVLGAMQLAPGMTVADVGAGTGYFELHLSRAVGPAGKVLALDVEPDMVTHLRDRAARERLSNVEARQVPAEEPALAPASVDRVLIVDTWHHIGARDAYAQHLAAALRAGGQVVVVDFKLDAHRGPPLDHRIPPGEVVRTLASAGLSARIVEAGLPEQYIVVGSAR